ncbi:hypothetical protein BT69DRAFT_1332467 [Atractiella rhizophila]|nr:hypothetical protein BT69DRAFT_1332467 [Atractiella rhizophila]
MRQLFVSSPQSTHPALLNPLDHIFTSPSTPVHSLSLIHQSSLSISSDHPLLLCQLSLPLLPRLVDPGLSRPCISNMDIPFATEVLLYAYSELSSDVESSLTQ